jgi:hypothetical protein
MKPQPEVRELIWQSALLLRLAGLLVPRPQRRQWYSEWYAEVWHWAHFLAKSGRPGPHSRAELIRHCRGAFLDAFWLRFDQERLTRLWQETPRSGPFCLGLLASLLLIVVAITGLAPTIRSGFSPLAYKQPDRVAELSLEGQFSHYHEATLFLATRKWANQSKTAQDVAGYSWHPMGLRLPGKTSTSWLIAANVSPDFFELLGNGASAGRMIRAGDVTDCADCAVITWQLAQKLFGHESEAPGRTILIDGTPQKVIGVLPANFSFIFPEISVWLLPSADPQAVNFASRTGVVLRLSQGAALKEAAAEFLRFAERDPSSFGYARPRLGSLESRARQGARLYLLFSVLSLLGGFALAGSRLGDARRGRLPFSPRESGRWWGFFILKVFLLLVTSFVVAIEFTGRASLVLTGAMHPLTGPISVWLFLVLAMLALIWAMHDQSRRCRLCLKRLGNEASVGAAGYLLLDWWGTELVCSHGHGLLHVPELKSSWQEYEQWMELDDSWKPLFEDEVTTVP